MINSLISEFSVEQLKLFFRRKITKFKPIKENYEYLFDDKEEITDNFMNIIRIGEANLNSNDDLLVITAKTNEPLTNRTGKKRQYEIAKKILKEENKDAAFFIFYDENINFRFSFIRANFLGTKRDFTNFKRYTYFVSKKLTNKTFISQISKADFNDLNSIQEAFNVEPLTKQFYEKLQHWYFWAIENVKFPDDAEEEKNGREIAIIRLITRLMFIWFMKVRNLIPDDLFDEDNINKILQNSSSQESTYYKAILQNLFFATLNTKQIERKFRTETRGYKGYNPDFGNQNVFRYHDLFRDSESLKNLFDKIPFLNGGLFECLDYKPKGEDKEERKYIDGFTATKGKQPIVPNFLFFSEVQKKDISKFYGKKNKTYAVEGLINLLKSYNFTIDENEADDIEVALDPELLGSIFENLLASYNPETSTTARKATGSFYTPREIVNYMTNESLKQYFITHLKTDTSVQTELEKKLDSLITSNNSENPFDSQSSKKITKLIDDLRVVDPAVGSGAFPMAVLNKLVFVLSKIDPDNTFWEQTQLDSAKKIPDVTSRKTAIESIKKRFQEKNADYGRKLYLIEKCIYGVDIQQIAVEIAKLRFFISLLVDEKIEWDKPENNYGIEPLPNLDFKLMQGNSLISSFAGIDFDKPEKLSEDSLFDMNNENTELINKFEELKNEYQNESEKERKDELREEIEKSIYKIVEDKIIPQIRRIEEKYSILPNAKQREEAITEEKQKLAKKLGFDIEQIEKDLKAYTEGRKPKDFFLWKVYFAEVFTQKDGFDIVIGNPPYISINHKEKNKYISYQTISSLDLFAFFFEKTTDLLNHFGILSFITSSLYVKGLKFESLRSFLVNYFSLIELRIEGDKVFENVQMPTATFIGQITNLRNTWSFDRFTSNSIIMRIKTGSKILGDITNSIRGLEIGRDKLLSEGNYKIVSGSQVERYFINDIKFITKDTFRKFKKDIFYFSGERILFRETGSFIVSVYTVSSDLLSTRTLFSLKISDKCFSYKYLLALLNSKLMQYYFTVHFKADTDIFPKIRMAQARRLPIKSLSSVHQKLFEKKVGKIISKKELGEDTKELENKIDIMVYKLYELTYEEVKIVDPEFWLSKKEYENFKL